MQNAPPVLVPVGRFVWGGRILGGLAVVGAAGLLCWQQWTGSSWVNMSVAGMVWLMAVVLAFVLWRHEQLDEGLLIWTGQAWFWRAQQAEELPIRMALLLDAGGCLLVAVNIEPDQPNKKSLTRYACFTHRSMPSLWHGFRCAVYSRPMAVALDSPRNGP